MGPLFGLRGPDLAYGLLIEDPCYSIFWTDTKGAMDMANNDDNRDNLFLSVAIKWMVSKTDDDYDDDDDGMCSQNCPSPTF